MKPIAYNVYVLMMFLAYVMRRAGTFSIEDKVRMIEFLSYMALNPNSRIEERGGAEIRLREAMRCQPSQVDHLLALSQASKSLVHNLHP